MTATLDDARRRSVTGARDAGNGWRTRPVAQQPSWPDPHDAELALAELRTMPALVLASECDALREQLALVGQGRAFALMGGDCAETFGAVSLEDISGRVRTLLQMSAVLSYGTGLPVVKIGRLAGQFAKPRSVVDETHNGVTLPAYRGDIINGAQFTEQARRPDPRRMLRAYHCSTTTLNLVRALGRGGLAGLGAVQASDRRSGTSAFARDESAAREVERALRFMATCPTVGETVDGSNIHIAHEALLLDYEDALTRLVTPCSDRVYAGSAHLLWIGERTRQLDGAHIAFAASVENPIGVKVGPTAEPGDLVALIEAVNPSRIPGRLSLITRLGAGQVTNRLPALLAAVARTRHPVQWICDPMHGNTVISRHGRKTRHFNDIVAEVAGFFAAHRQVGTTPGGIHVELTGNDVTECVGGGAGVTEDALGDRYETACDPRLNPEQSLELAFLVARLLDQS
jgi:3-deoxy-7-phosphoheptulonate synthase